MHQINRCIVYFGFDIVGLEQNAAPSACKSRDAMEYISIKLSHQDMGIASYLARQTVAWWTAHEDSKTGYGLYSPGALFTNMV